MNTTLKFSVCMIRIARIILDLSCIIIDKISRKYNFCNEFFSGFFIPQQVPLFGKLTIRNITRILYILFTSSLQDQDIYSASSSVTSMYSPDDKYITSFLIVFTVQFYNEKTLPNTVIDSFLCLIDVHVIALHSKKNRIKWSFDLEITQFVTVKLLTVQGYYITIDSIYTIIWPSKYTVCPFLLRSNSRQSSCQ